MTWHTGESWLSVDGQEPVRVSHVRIERVERDRVSDVLDAMESGATYADVADERNGEYRRQHITWATAPLVADPDAVRFDPAPEGWTIEGVIVDAVVADDLSPAHWRQRADQWCIDCGAYLVSDHEHDTGRCVECANADLVIEVPWTSDQDTDPQVDDDGNPLPRLDDGPEVRMTGELVNPATVMVNVLRHMADELARWHQEWGPVVATASEALAAFTWNLSRIVAEANARQRRQWQVAARKRLHR